MGAIVKQARVNANGVLEIEQQGEWKPAGDVPILGAGGKESVGQVIIGEDFSFYVINTQPDLQATINKLIDVCTELVNVCNNETYVVTATAAVLGPLPALVAIGTQVDAIKTELSEFKLL